MKVLAALLLATAALTAFSRTNIDARREATWDSVYTDAQAATWRLALQGIVREVPRPRSRGTPADGGRSSKAFLDSWNGMTLDQLFNKSEDAVRQS